MLISNQYQIQEEKKKEKRGHDSLKATYIFFKVTVIVHGSDGVNNADQFSHFWGTL